MQVEVATPYEVLLLSRLIIQGDDEKGAIAVVKQVDLVVLNAETLKINVTKLDAIKMDRRYRDFPSAAVAIKLSIETNFGHRQITSYNDKK